MLLHEQECFHLRPDRALAERWALIRFEWEGRRQDLRASSKKYMRGIHHGAGVSEEGGLSLN